MVVGPDTQTVFNLVSEQLEKARKAFVENPSDATRKAYYDAVEGARGMIRPKYPTELSKLLTTKLSELNISPEGGAPIDLPKVEKVPDTDIPVESDRGEIELEAAREDVQQRAALEEITGVRRGGREELARILTGQQERLFKEAIPNIMEESQAAGLLRSSGLGEALGREAGRLTAGTTASLAMAGLSDIDVESTGLQNIMSNRLGLQQSGLQRQFSMEDFEKEAGLARELGAQVTPRVGGDDGGFDLAGALSGGGMGMLPGLLMLSNPATAPYAMLAMALGGGGGFLSGGKGGGTYLCTHLKKLGFMKEEAVKSVHDMLFPYAFLHPIDLILYAIYAPKFIKDNPDLDWQKLKPYVCNHILASKTRKEAFHKYRDICRFLFFGIASDSVKEF